MNFQSSDAYYNHLERAKVPQGFAFACAETRFTPAQRPQSGVQTMNLAAIVSSEPNTILAGLTTSNRVVGAPVVIARQALRHGRARGCIVNNRVANVAVADALGASRTVAAAAAARFGLPAGELLPVSTGVIGWSLPVEAMVEQIETMALGDANPLQVARAIMTTDRYPKIAWIETGGARILAFAKGAGMIEPNMRTMLVFVLTDAAVRPSVAQRALRRVAAGTVNAITVDGDQSTSDMCLLFANGRSAVRMDAASFEGALGAVLEPLARDIVRNGEGTRHLIEVRVVHAASTTVAERVARKVANSPLVKTAIAGNDPNVGRIVAAIGAAAGARLRTDQLSIDLCGRSVYRNGAVLLDATLETQLGDLFRAAESDPTLHYPQARDPITIRIDLGHGRRHVVVYASDLTHEYVSENADYRT